MLLLGLFVRVVTALAINAPVTYTGYHGTYFNPWRSTTTSTTYVKKGSFSPKDSHLSPAPNSTITVYTIYSGYNSSISIEGPASAARFKYTPTAENPYLFIHFANYMFVGYGSHEPLYDRITVKNPSGSTIGCTYDFRSTNSYYGDVNNHEFHLSTGYDSYGQMYQGYRDWDVMVYDLTQYVGRTITIEVIASCCSNIRCYSYLYLGFEATHSIEICAAGSSTSTRVEAPKGLPSYQWLEGSASGQVVGTNYYYDIPAGKATNYYCRFNGYCSNTLLMAKAEKPIPEFDYDIHCGATADTVFITNTSRIESVTGSRPPEAIEWDFGNGTYSTDYAPAPVIYNKDEDHTITLHVGDSGFACDSTTQQTIPGSQTLQSTDYAYVCLEDIPYEWHGNKYMTTGTFFTTLTNRFGCDSIVQLNLTVAKPFTRQYADTALCENDSFLWHGQLVHEEGYYYDTLHTSYGCDSIRYQLHVTHRKVSYSDTYLTLCDKWIPYSWNGKTCYTSGEYSVTLVNAAGCDSIARLHLTINEYSASDTTAYVCSEDLPYEWHGRSLTQAGEVHDTLRTIFDCDSIVTLHLVVHAPEYKEENYHICYGETLDWHNRTYDATGTYLDTFYYAKTGCDSIRFTMNLVVGEQPTEIIKDTTICENESYSWHGQTVHEARTYYDTIRDRFDCDSVCYTLNVKHYKLQTSTTNLTICYEQVPFTWNSFTCTEDGTYTETNLTDIHGCDSTAILHLTINEFSASDTVVYLCSEDLAAMGSYAWHGKSLSAAGQLKDTVKNSVNCDSIITLTLIVHAPEYKEENYHICYGETLNWHNRTYDATGTYLDTFHYAKTDCDSIRFTMNLVVGEQPTKIHKDTSICEDQVFEWHGQQVHEIGTYYDTLRDRFDCDSILYSLTVNHYLLTGSETFLTICYEQLPYTWNGITCEAGDIYLVHLVNSHGCDSAATLYLTVRDFCKSDTVAYACSEELPYLWHGQECFANGVYTDTLTNKYGCDSVVYMHLNVQTPKDSVEFHHICYGDTYYWHGQTCTESTHYFDTMRYVHMGCDSIRFDLQLEVGPEPVYKHLDTLICEDDYFYWYEQEVHSPTTYYHTVKDRWGCDSVYWSMSVKHKRITYSTTSLTLCYEQMPYTWNGQTFTKGGKYIVHLINQAGCDSVATLNLTVREFSSTDTIVIRCITDGPYTWYGRTLTQTDTLQRWLINSVGCDSVVTLYYYTSTFCDPVHPIDPRVDCDTTYSQLDTTIRYGVDTIMWFELTYSTPGIYHDTLRPNSLHCDSIGTLILRAYYTDTMIACPGEDVIMATPFGYKHIGTADSLVGCLFADENDTCLISGSLVVNRYTDEITTIEKDTFICQGDKIDWFNLTISKEGTYEYRLKNITGCDSVRQYLHVSVHYPTQSLTKDTICHGDTLLWNGYKFGHSIDTTIVLVNAAQCDSFCQLQLVVLDEIPQTDLNIVLCQGETIDWHGQTISTSGDYTKTLDNIHGCDSTVILHVTYLYVKDSIETYSMCHSDSYLWHGQSITSAGTYYDTIRYQHQDCDSIRFTLTVKTSPAPVSQSKDTSFCYGESMEWHGQTCNQTGVYYDTLRNAHGCDSIYYQLNLTIYQPPESHTTIKLCPSVLPFVWNGKSYDAAGDYSFHTQNAHMCDSTAYLHLIITPTEVKDTMAVVCRTELPYIWHQQSLTQEGVYTDTLQNTVGCDSVIRLNLYVTNFCDDDHPIDPRVDCDTTYSTLDTTIAYGLETVLWFGQTYANPGIYHDTIKNCHNCDSVGTLLLRVTYKDSASVCGTTPYTFTTPWGDYTTPDDCDCLTGDIVKTADNESLVWAQLCVTRLQPTDSTTTATICEGESFNWYGHIYTTNKDTSMTLTNAAGCDSICTLHLTILPKTYGYENQSTCSIPYIWHGKEATNGDTIILTNIYGCDSIVTLNLTIHSPTDSTTTATICEGESFNWYGHIYKTAKDTSITLTNAAGCDSICTLHLTVLPKTYGYEDQSTCSIPYIWHGKEATNGDTIILQNVYGCDSIVTLNLTILAPTDSITTATICEGESFNWYGHIYTTNKDTSMTLTNAVGCDSICELHLTVLPKTYGYENLSTCSIPYIWHGKEATNGDTIKLTNIYGCDSIITLNLTILAPTDSSTTATICEGESFNWYGHIYKSAKDTSMTLTNAVGCDSICSLHLTVLPKTYGYEFLSTCSIPYIWHGKEATNGDTIILQNVYGCDSIVTLNLTILAPTDSTTTATICEGESFNWYGHIYKTAKDTSMTLTNAAGCDSICTLHLTVNPIKRQRSERSICEGTTTTWRGRVLDKAGTYDTIIYSVNGCDSIRDTLDLNILMPTRLDDVYYACYNDFPFNLYGHRIELPGEYEWHLTNKAGCDSTIALTVYKSPTPTKVVIDTSFCDGTHITWRGQEIWNAGYYQDVIHCRDPHFEHCDSIYLELHVTKKIRTYCDTTVYVGYCDLPYKWKTAEGYLLEFYKSDKYIENLTNAAGCDSTLVLNIVVSDTASIVEQDTTICAGETLLWQGQTISTPGDYYYTTKFKNIHYQHCDSVRYKLHVNVLYPQNIVIFDTICQGDTVMWYKQACTKNGIYRHILSYENGCDSVLATLHLTVNEPSSSLTEAFICLGSSYQWNGHTFTNSIDTTIYLINQAGCDSMSRLVLTAGVCCPDTQMVKTYLPGVCDTLIPYNWRTWRTNAIKISTPGHYEDTLRNKWGCDSIIYTLDIDFYHCCRDLKGEMGLGAVCADDDYLSISLDLYSGMMNEYRLHFTNPALNTLPFRDTTVHLTEEDWMTGAIDIDIPIPYDPLDSTHYPRPDVYYVDILVGDSCGNSLHWDRVPFTVLYPSWLIVQRWNDVLALYNERYNGGYTFSEIRWFHEDSLLTARGEHDGYIYIRPTLEYGTPYHAELTRTDDGKTFPTCNFYPHEQRDTIIFKEQVEISHTLIEPKTTRIWITTNTSGTYNIYDVSGTRVQQGFFGAEYNTFYIDFDDRLPEGVYIIVFRGKNLFDSKKVIYDK